MKKLLSCWLLPLALLMSCTREPLAPDAPSAADGQVTSVVHYSATVGEAAPTKASLNGLKQYIFETEDKLYVTSGTDMYGILHLVAGAGSTTATFEGDLMCLDDFAPSGSTSLSATLVSPSDIHNIAQSRVTGVDYPKDAYTRDLAEAVRKYSHFTATGTYAAHAFSLEQQTTFLMISVCFTDAEAADIPENKKLTAILTNNDGADELCRGEWTTEDVDFSMQASFVAALPTTTLSKAALTFKAGDTVISTDSDIAKDSDIALQANRYYDITRSHFDLKYFTIQAKEAGTTVTFNHTGSGIQYRKNGEGAWTDYNTETRIALNQKEYLQFRGNKNSYQGENNGTKPLFTADKTCYIYGDLMSLCSNVSGTEYTPRTDIGADYAFRYAFKKATWVDIPAGRPLILSATGLRQYSYSQMFSGCTSLTHAPELPATTLSKGAYDHMFDGCTSLVAAPDLPATTLGEAAYCYMFSGCTSLTGVPAELKGTSARQVCQSMFQNCTSLATAPALPSETVGQQGYQSMFQGCTSLVRSPELPATSVASQGYQDMFNGCTSLTQGPSDLPATAIATKSYLNMFRGCSSLSSGPESIAATAIPEEGCKEMFRECISLNRGPSMDGVTEIGKNGCQNMFYGCSSLASFSGLDRVTTLGNYACSAMFYNCGELTTTPEQLPALSIPEGAYKEMYRGCTKITRAPSILATEAVGASGDNNGAFQNMFYSCRRLATPPTTLGIAEVPKDCYRGMFQGCSALASAPDLSTMTSVGKGGCKDMFNGCSVLREPPVLPAITIGQSCYEQMFMGAGIESAPSLNAQTLFDYCYKKMFNGCKYLKGPVLLPATELVKECYREMFDGAKLLDAVITLAAKTNSAEYCTTNWLNNVSATGTFIRPDPEGVDDWAPNSASGIPKGWTVQDFGIEPIFPEDPFDPEEDL